MTARVRLSVIDRAFLLAETRETPMHVGGLQVFKVPPGASRHFVSNLAAKLRTYPVSVSPLNYRLTGGYLQGNYVLPLSVVARVLLRMQRRFYDGNRSYLKNIVQCDPQDALPDHFVRLTLLNWFERRLRVKGPAGVEGFHRASEMIADLAALGHDAERVKTELMYLAREGCVVAEHLRTDRIDDEDLIKITLHPVLYTCS